MSDKKFANLRDELESLRDRHKSIEGQVKQLEEKILELYTLYSISKTLSLSHQLDDLFNGTMEMMGDALGISEFCIMLLQGDELVVRVAHGMGDKILNRLRLSINEGISGKVARTGKPILLQDVSKAKDFLYYKGLKKDIGSFLSVPLKIDDRILGVMNTHHPRKNGFKTKDLDFYTAVAEHVAVAVEKAHIFEKTKEDALRDELTQLYNRRFFFEKLAKEIKRAKRYKKVFSIVMMDLDHFKSFNDINGHIQGDYALRESARIILKNLRGEDIAARFGGEEFILLLPEISKEGAISVAEKLRKGVASERFVGEEFLPGAKLTASFGVSTFPEDSDDGLQLIDLADKALYLSKSRGRNKVFSSNDLSK